MMLATICVTVSVFLCIETTSAVPAIVWNKSPSPAHDDGAASLYVSNEISFEQMLMSETSSLSNSKNTITVLYLLERDRTTGQELLTSRTPLLQQTLQQHPQAPKQYSHVTGIESSANVLKKCKACAATSAMEPVLVNLNELGYKLNQTLPLSNTNTQTMMMMDGTGDIASSSSLMSPPKKNMNKATATKRDRLIATSNLVVVSIPDHTSADVLDASVRHTLAQDHVATVILSSVRSVEEVKYERHLSMRRSLLEKTILVDATVPTKNARTTDPYHRRLEEQQQDNNNNLSGIYYVQMTPNIFSGLLFFGMFTVITMIGISCMNMITGQDVYVSTMPSVGREA